MRARALVLVSVNSIRKRSWHVEQLMDLSLRSVVLVTHFYFVPSIDIKIKSSHTKGQKNGETAGGR